MSTSSYLDDLDHVWQLEDNEGRTISLKALMGHLYTYGEDADISIVLQGYHGLKSRFPDATDLDCFDTSMIWMFG